jgi:uncharacterized membrane protein
LALIVVFLLFKFTFLRGYWMRHSWPDTSPDAILKRRLANGEISEADYQRLRETLNK